MSVTNLDALFRPRSVAVVGATNSPKHPGSIVMRNLLHGRFLGPVMPVAPAAQQEEAVCGVLTYPDVAGLPLTPDLAIYCGPPQGAPAAIEALGRRGTRACILLGSGFAAVQPEERGRLELAVRQAAQATRMRLLGPGCLGLISPAAGLNASLAHTDAAPGRIAFVTQSDSLFTTVLDWARANGIGFSHFISLGDQLDVSFSSVLDYLGSDPLTRSILLYVESVCEARTFMSAARASARSKPILVMKPGRDLPSLRPDASCALPSQDADAVYDVAFRRAGMIRVNAVDALFDGAQTLAKSGTLFADGLAIVTNGRSVGLMAAEACVAGGGSLATFAEDTAAALAAPALRHALPRGPENPLCLRFDAPGSDYAKVIETLLKDQGVAAVLVLHVPFAQVDGLEIAQAVAKAVARTKRVVLTSWLGSETDKNARGIFREAGLPTFETPDKAVGAYLHMVAYRRVQELLMETPDSLPPDFFPDVDKARSTIETALAEGRSRLDEAEARDVLLAYGVPVVETRFAVSAKEAVLAAEAMGYPVALKIRSAQIPHPFQVGGVALDLEGPEQVWDTAAAMVARIHKHNPAARIDGFVVQQMGRRPGAVELALGAFVDPVFGPVIRFGQGGMAAAVLRDTAVALPPLNTSLARELIGRTRVAKLLPAAPDRPAVDVDDICLSLIQLSQLLIDLPQVVELAINPLFADDKGVLALGAAIRVAPPGSALVDGTSRLAIRPYPRELEERASLHDGTQILLRPIRPEDAPAHFDFVKSLTSEDLRLRFFGAPREFSFADMAAFTHVDYDREMAFIATRPLTTGDSETLGVVRAATRPDNEAAEFAIIVRNEMKGTGLGKALLDKMIHYVKSRGTKVLEATTLPENSHMIGLARRLGFTIKTDYEDEVVEMKLPLNP